MKVRWTRSSVRLRITPDELEALTRGETVRETLAFAGGGGWTAMLEPNAATTELRFDGNVVAVRLAEDALAALARPEAEGVYYSVSGDPGLRYYVEKDFPCAHPRAGTAQERETATFAAPDGFEKRKSASSE